MAKFRINRFINKPTNTEQLYAVALYTLKYVKYKLFFKNISYMTVGHPRNASRLCWLCSHCAQETTHTSLRPRLQRYKWRLYANYNIVNYL